MFCKKRKLEISQIAPICTFCIEVIGRCAIICRREIREINESIFSFKFSSGIKGFYPTWLDGKGKNSNLPQSQESCYSCEQGKYCTQKNAYPLLQMNLPFLQILGLKHQIIKNLKL